MTQEVQKSNLRRTWLFALAGVVLGFTGATLRGPEMVSFFFKPLQDSFSCAGSVNTALGEFVKLQLTCAMLGGVIALIALFFWRRYMKQRAEAKQARNAST